MFPFKSDDEVMRLKFMLSKDAPGSVVDLAQLFAEDADGNQTQVPPPPPPLPFGEGTPKRCAKEGVDGGLERVEGEGLAVTKRLICRWSQTEAVGAG